VCCVLPASGTVPGGGEPEQEGKVPHRKGWRGGGAPATTKRWQLRVAGQLWLQATCAGEAGEGEAQPRPVKHEVAT
jgi:hypothetical protein